jgi:DNA polymerase elongation subunit (family B)
MLDHIKPESLLCIDIETVPEYKSIADLDAEFQKLYLQKSERLQQPGETDEEKYFNHAGIYAEFAKIICISLGIFIKEKKTGVSIFRVKSFQGHDEKQLLTDFIQLLNKYYKDPNKYFFAGHNIREFDIPFICRRILINQLKMPTLLDISGRKPYEIQHVDTMQLWRFGDYKNYTSLQLLAKILKIESPKIDIQGSDVARVYWIENDLPRIVSYCERDVITIAQLIRRFKGLPLLTSEQIQQVSIF